MGPARAVGIGLVAVVVWTGCGTTKWTDTARTATEQLLITDSIDRAVSRLDFRALAGKKVFVDDTPIKHVTDSAYLLSAVRQHVVASGAILKDKREEADYILEIRAGAVGTDRHDLLFGIPAVSLPTATWMTGVPSQIPEIPFIKKTDQRGVAKISMFAYNKQTGRPVWQSGAIPEESRTKAVWVFGAGPFQRGTIHKGTRFAGDRVHIPLVDPMLTGDGHHRSVAVADEAFFVEPKDHHLSEPKSVAADTAAPGATQGPGETAPGPSSGVVLASPAAVQAGPPPDPSNPQQVAPPASEATPASAVMPLPPTEGAPPGAMPRDHILPGDIPLGDTWLGRRR